MLKYVEFRVSKEKAKLILLSPVFPLKLRLMICTGDCCRFFSSQGMQHHATIQAVADRIRNPKWSCIGVAGIMYGYIGDSIQFCWPANSMARPKEHQIYCCAFSTRAPSGPHVRGGYLLRTRCMAVSPSAVFDMLRKFSVFVGVTFFGVVSGQGGAPEKNEWGKRRLWG